MGFETVTTEYVGDRGVDVIGILNAEGLTNIRLKVQVRRVQGNIGIKEVQRIKSEGDYQAAQELVENYSYAENVGSHGGVSGAVQKQGFSESALAEFTVNVSTLAKLEQLEPVIGREREIQRTLQVLLKRKKNNPILSNVFREYDIYFGNIDFYPVYYSCHNNRKIITPSKLLFVF